MELFQELLFTISFSLIVSLLIAKLFSMVSSFDHDDDDSSPRSKRVEEKIERGWVVCDSEFEEKVGCFEDAVKVNDHGVEKIGEEVVCKGGEVEVEGSVLENLECVCAVDESAIDRMVSDEIPERTDLHQEEVDEEVVCRDDVEVEGPSGALLENTGSVGAVDESEIEREVTDEIPERTNFDQEEANFVKDNEDGVADDANEVRIEEGFDDWEGIERTELEKRFGAAVAFLGSKSNADRISLIDNEAKMQLYGLHKISTEGPCVGPQPMALMVSARANWNAWKRLENLGPEDAMEQYIALLSRYLPDWMGTEASEDNKQVFLAAGTTGELPLDFKTTGAEKERKLEQLKPCSDECVCTAVDDTNITTWDKQ